MYEEKEEDLELGLSPGQDLAKDKAFTDRTSKLVYFIGRELSTPQRLRETTELLSMTEASIRWALGQYVFLHDRENPGLPINLDGFGMVALAGVPLPEWPYEDPLIDLTGYPRLLIHTAFNHSQFPALDQDQYAESLRPGGVVERRIVRWTYRPLLVRGILLPANEIHWDWRDVEALEETSFHVRLMCFRYSMNMLYHHVLPKLWNYRRGSGGQISQSSIRL